MNEVLFIRHAETDMAGTFCGHSNPSVNASGWRQIAELVSTLQVQPLDAIFSSDLHRAITTAEALANAFGAPLNARPNLREINFGDWEGLTWTQIERSDPAYAQRWIDEYPHLPAPNGERFEAFQARVIGEMNRLHAYSGLKRIAVVTHAGVLRVVLRALCGLDEQEAFNQTQTYCGSFVVTLAADLYEVSK